MSELVKLAVVAAIFVVWGGAVLAAEEAPAGTRQAGRGSAAVIDLAGSWGFAGDPEDVGIAQEWFDKGVAAGAGAADTIELPGTIDAKGYGEPHGREPEMTREVLHGLARRHTYVGPAWYEKEVEVPAWWAGQAITLNLERVIWETRVWVDGEPAGMGESLIAPHVFELTGLMTPGRHRLTVRIDNRKKYNVGPMAHAHSNETQIMWNGVIGEIALEARPRVHVADIQVYPDAAARKVRARVTLANGGAEAPGELVVSAMTVRGERHVAAPVRAAVAIPAGGTVAEVEVELGEGMRLWDEFSPAMYELTARVVAGETEHERAVRFGVRSVETKGQDLRINGRRVFLRGTLECCIFPNTGHPPMDVAEWKRILLIARSYGLNHLRFHSWCPPEAAFAAADELGFYYHVELPLWAFDLGKDEPRDAFLKREADRLMQAYGNHPSFLGLSIGNELIGDFEFIHSLVRHFQENDPRHLYTSTTFSFQDQHGRWPEPVDEFFVTQATLKGWTRGQGFFDQQAASTAYDYRASIEGVDVPVIGHEVGQYAVFPVFAEIEKYTGVQEPVNLKAIRAELERKGLLHLADEYVRASGALSVLLYKADIELCLRTEGMSGFQLLDLHDFPGQGTALIGTLDAFWDSKGLIEPAAYRRFCSATVPLARMERLTWENAQTFEAAVEVAHYGPADMEGAVVAWDICDADGRVVREGRFEPITVATGGNTAVGTVRAELGSLAQASKLVLTVRVNAAQASNSWDFWVYPAGAAGEAPAGVLVADFFDDEVEAALRAGRTVVLLPEPASLANKEMGRFMPVFWSPVHFPNQPVTMGLLCDPGHPAFGQFPTEFHTNWQWWELLSRSASVVMDEGPREFEPIVRMVDGFTKNRRLYNLFEARVGGGRLLFCSLDIANDLDERLAARQLRRSLMGYVGSAEFAPRQELAVEFVRGLFHETSMRGAKVVSVSSAQPGYGAELAIDGDLKTFWHTAWSPEVARYPHELVIELAEPVTLLGFTYTPRQDGNPNGRVARWEFYASQDGTEWGRPLGRGEFANDGGPKKVVFEGADAIYGEALRARYVRFVAVSGFGEDPHGSAAEIDLLVK